MGFVFRDSSANESEYVSDNAYNYLFKEAISNFEIYSVKAYNTIY